MALTGQTLVRFCGALMLGSIATAIDHPRATPSPAPERQPAVAEVPQAIEPRITPGKRAFAVVFAGVPSMAGMIWPNSRVDVLLVGPPSEGPKRVAKLLDTNVRVLAVEGGRRRSATTGVVEDVWVAVLEVTPEEAEALAVAQTRGVIHLALRDSNGEEPPIPRGRARELAPWVSR